MSREEGPARKAGPSRASSSSQFGRFSRPKARDRASNGNVGNVELGSLGVWWSGSWKSSSDGPEDVPAGLESLGYGTLWSSGGFRPGLARHFERLLASTRQMEVASGIVSIWKASPDDLASAITELDHRYPGRFLLGLGASHAPLAEDYSQPFRRMSQYLDALDSLDAPVHKQRRVLAALGPRMLELAGSRSAGAHPYFVPVEHTAHARQILGTGPLLAPEITVTVDTDTSEARRRARSFMTTYLALPNYANNLRRLGFDEADLSDNGSDRLVDALVAHGDAEAVATRIREHLEAGADHVAVQVLSPEEGFPFHDYRDIASILLPG